MDTDPCTGKVTDRQVASGTLKAGDVRNKFVIRITDAVNTNATREYRFKTTKGAKTTNQGIEAGQYVTPITEIVWPELNVPGTPQVPNAFQLFGNLANGIVNDDVQFGPLRPWPGATAPTPSKVCTGDELKPSPSTPATYPADAVPTAYAGLAQLLPPGTVVSITGANNNTALKATDLTFAWKQTLPAGETLTIKGADTAKMSFTSPAQTASQAVITREFELKICLVSDSTKCSTDRVKVTTDRAQKDTVTITGYQYASSNGGRITVTATSNVVLTGNSGAKLQLFLGTETTGRAMTQDTTDGGLYTYTARSIGKQPASIKVTSALLGSDSRTALLRRRTMWERRNE